MARPAYRLSSDVLDQWRPNGDRISYKDAGWSGAAVGVVMHAALHFFSVALPALDRAVAIFGPAERLAYGLTAGFDPLATWFMLLLSVAVWGAFSGIALLASVHVATDFVRAVVLKREATRAE